MQQLGGWEAGQKEFGGVGKQLGLAEGRACAGLETETPLSSSSLADFSNQVNSTSLNSPTSRGPMATPSLHPSIGPGIGSSLGSPGQLHSPISTLSSPINGMGPPFSVISSPMGPHSMSVPSTPSLGFGTSSPQVRGRGWGRGPCSFIGARTQPGRGGGDDPGPVVLPKRARGANPPRRHPRRGGQAPKGGEKQKPKGEMKPGLLRQGGGTAGAQGWIASIHPSAAISCPPCS